MSFLWYFFFRMVDKDVVFDDISKFDVLKLKKIEIKEKNIFLIKESKRWIFFFCFIYIEVFCDFEVN